MGKKRAETEIPDDLGLESQPAAEDPGEDGPTLKPVKIVMTRMADWAGGHESVPVHDGAHWRILRRELGGVVVEATRAPEKGAPRKAFWIPDANIRFIEFDTE